MVQDLGNVVVPPPMGEAATPQNSVGVVNQKIVANEQTKQQIDLGKITNNFSKYIVRPLNAFGLGGFVFDNEDETKVNLTTEITDHYTEDNVAIQDHIAVKPKKVTLKNFVGELVFRRDETTETTTQNVVRKLTILDSYLPELSAAASQARDLFLTESSNLGVADLTFDDAVRGATDLYSLAKNLNPPIKRQEQAYMYFKALMEQKILVSVQTPFEFMNNMAIETIEAVQPPNTKDISEFTITLKEMRFTKLQLIPFDRDNYQGRTESQRQDVEKQGEVAGRLESQANKIFESVFFGDEAAKEALDPNEFSDLEVFRTGN